MKVVGLESGRLTLLVDLLEISPPGGIYAVELAEAIQRKYLFLVTKPPTAEAAQFRFENGRGPDGKLINAFEIHPQGIVVQSIDTKSADIFLTDVLAVGEKDFKLRMPSHLSKKVYLSSLVAEFESDIGGLLAKGKALMGLLGAQLKTLYGIETPSSLHRITLRPDVEKLPPRLAGVINEFTLERRVFAPYESHRFHSSAPLPTDQHIEFLKRLDELAA